MIIIISLISLLFDMGSKYLISRMFTLYESKIIINNFLNITYVRNTGAAWSILDTNTWIVTVISLLIIIGIIYYIYRNRNKINKKIVKIGYGLVLGGSIGNFIDRIIYGYVVDFIDIDIFGWNYPIFNLADMFIVGGVILLMIDAWRCRNDRD